MCLHTVQCDSSCHARCGSFSCSSAASSSLSVLFSDFKVSDQTSKSEYGERRGRVLEKTSLEHTSLTTLLSRGSHSSLRKSSARIDHDTSHMSEVLLSVRVCPTPSGVWLSFLCGCAVYSGPRRCRPRGENDKRAELHTPHIHKTTRETENVHKVRQRHRRLVCGRGAEWFQGTSGRDESGCRGAGRAETVATI